MPPSRTSSFPRPPPGPGHLSRSSTTFTLTPRPTVSTADPARGVPLAAGHPSQPFEYHVQARRLHAAFEPAVDAAPEAAKSALQQIRAVEAARADGSRRFLGAKLRLSGRGPAVENGCTFLTLRSANTTWGTLLNAATFGLSAPLCRVYFVEIMLEDRVVAGDAQARSFVQHELGLRGDAASGRDLVSWIEYQEKNEMRRFGFEKLQGNSFAVYLITVPRFAGGPADMVDTVPLRERAERKYSALDGLDSVVMLGGRFHNSVWSLLQKRSKVER